MSKDFYTEVEDFMEVFTEEDHADIEARDAVFKRLTAEFTCELGKQESRRER